MHLINSIILGLYFLALLFFSWGPLSEGIIIQPFLFSALIILCLLIVTVLRASPKKVVSILTIVVVLAPFSLLLDARDISDRGNLLMIFYVYIIPPCLLIIKGASILVTRFSRS